MLHQILKAAAASPVSLRASRRGFLLGAAATAGGLAVGFRPAPLAAQDPAPGPIDPFRAYLTITPDDRITIVSSQFDMGQGSYHGIATLALEELGARFDQIDVVGGWGDLPAYGNLAWGGFAQGTGGSSSMTSSWDRYRIAGAAAREMLVAAAADAWGVPQAEIAAADGRLTHPAGRSASYGEMAGRAAAMPVPQAPALKAPGDWRLIGNADLRRFDSAAKTDGTHPFTIDVRLPGMLTATMIHPPKFGARVASFDATGAKAIPGVVDVVETHRGLAVIGETMWAAIRGRDAVVAQWDESAAERRGTAELMAEYRALAAGAPAALALEEGDARAAIAGAAQVVEATFEFPYLAHAALEPLNAVAWMNPEGVVEIWGGHQMPDLYVAIAAEIAGVTPDRIRLHVMKTGGGFGRRGVMDADVIGEAVAAARAIGWRAPVKVQWTRENDMKGGRYRPAYVHAMRAGLDAEGRIVGLDHHIVGQSIMKGSPFEAMIEGDVDPTSVEGAKALPYAIGARRLGLTTTAVGVPVLWWRAVGATHTAFAVETFLDQLAAAAGRDPLEFRMAMLDASPRHREVLRLAAEKAGWGTPPPEGRVRGLALAESFFTYVAQVVEATVDSSGVKVHKVVCAVDCGVPINPDTIRAQMEGGIGFGLGAILAEEITLTGGAVDQANYDAYTPLRIEAMPEVEVHVVPSSEPPTGVGEPGVPPIGPAVANAIFAATGRPVTVLPVARAMSS